MVPFTTRTEHRDGVAVVAFTGDLDVATRRSAREALQAALNSGMEPLVLDLTDVEFLDSTGLTVLINTANDARRLSRAFAVVVPDGQARATIELAALGDELQTARTFADAVASGGW